MGLPAVLKLQVRDLELQRVQDRMHVGVQALLKVPIVDGVLVHDVSITSAGVSVSHGLGRQPLGWVVVSMNTADVVFENKTLRSDRTVFLASTSSSPVVVDLWVF